MSVLCARQKFGSKNIGPVSRVDGDDIFAGERVGYRQMLIIRARKYVLASLIPTYCVYL